MAAQSTPGMPHLATRLPSAAIAELRRASTIPARAEGALQCVLPDRQIRGRNSLRQSVWAPTRVVHQNRRLWHRLRCSRAISDFVLTRRRPALGLGCTSLLQGALHVTTPST